MDQQYKVRTTDTHVYFLTGPFSQWHPSEFMASLTPGGHLLRFSHAEQFMMAGKAVLFGDHETLAKIMSATEVDVYLTLVQEDEEDWDHLSGLAPICHTILWLLAWLSS
jgi:predicted NAD-dependent protein-ADP-ribosyltransferase YbiA (DUF1768 family)